MCDVIGIGEVRRREECFITLQSGHLLYHSNANIGQAGVGFLINRKWKDHNKTMLQVYSLPALYYSEDKLHQPQSSRTCSMHNKALQTKDSASICTNNIIFRRTHN